MSCFSLSIGISFIYSVIELLFLFLFIHCKLCLSLLTSFFDLLTLPTVKVKELISQPIYLKNSETRVYEGRRHETDRQRGRGEDLRAVGRRGSEARLERRGAGARASKQESQFLPTQSARKRSPRFSQGQVQKS